MIHDPRECYICKKVLEEDEGEEFCPFQLGDIEDYPVLVCETCEQSDKHQSNVEQTGYNHAAETSYQEWCASNSDDGDD